VCRRLAGADHTAGVPNLACRTLTTTTSAVASAGIRRTCPRSARGRGRVNGGCDRAGRPVVGGLPAATEATVGVPTTMVTGKGNRSAEDALAVNSTCNRGTRNREKKACHNVREGDASGPFLRRLVAEGDRVGRSVEGSWRGRSRHPPGAIRPGTAGERQRHGLAARHDPKGRYRSCSGVTAVPASARAAGAELTPVDATACVANDVGDRGAASLATAGRVKPTPPTVSGIPRSPVGQQ